MQSNERDRRTPSTIKDVASKANVSTATVSKYINGLKRFSTEVESRIDNAVKELGYHQNPLARSIITGRSGTIGLSIPDIYNPFFAALVKGASRVAAERGYTVLLVDSESGESAERQSLEDLCMRVDGIILSSRHGATAWSWLEDMPKPVVLFGTLNDGKGQRIGLKNALAGQMVINYLHLMGHRRVAYVGFDGAMSSSERLSGMLSQANVFGMDVFPTVVSETTPSEGAKCCKSLLLGLDADSRFDAVVCFNDMVAFGFMQQCRVLGIDIPKDISVVGFDNVPFCELVTPRLSSVNMGGERLGEIAANHLIDILNGVSNVRAIVEPELVLRDSVIDRRRLTS